MNYEIVTKYVKDLSFKINDAKSYFLLEKDIKNYTFVCDIKSKKLKEKIIQADVNLRLIPINKTSKRNLDVKVELTSIIQFTEMFMFGSARYLIVPCVWIVMGILAISSTFVLNQPSPVSATILQCCYLLSTIINLLSGWRICCDNWVKNAIRSNCHNTSAKTEASEMLQRFIIFGYLVLCFCYACISVCYFQFSVTDKGIKILWVMISLISPLAFYMSNTFLVV